MDLRREPDDLEYGMFQQMADAGGSRDWRQRSKAKEEGGARCRDAALETNPADLLVRPSD